MIVKKVPASPVAAGKSRAANVRTLCDYIAGPAAGGKGEKVEQRGALNLLNIDHDSQVQEMIDLARVARRSAQPVQHWIMSWQEGEQPTAVQTQDAVRVFLDEMGLSEHQAVYALHRDTQNWHLHVAINRVHPESEKVVTVNGGFDHEVAHRAVARIEHAQGWRREDRGLFVVKPEGSVERVRPRPDQEGRPSVRAAGHEERTGQRSAQRIAIEDGAPIIRRSRSWREVHDGLARQGMRLERKGSGAIVWIGGLAVKASAAGRDCSLSALEKRLGPYEPEPVRHIEATERREPESVELGSSGWEAYRAARDAHDARRAALREHAASLLEERRDLVERHRRERDQIFRRSWKGQGDLLNAMRSVTAMRQAQEKADLRDRQEQVRVERRRDRDRFPGYEEWLADACPEDADQWRHRERRPSTIEGPTFEQPVVRDIRAFRAVVEGRSIHYRLAGSGGIAAFTDRGKRIDIRSLDRDTVLAALQLSAQKWGTFTVEGRDAFRRTCVELAAEHGFKIANPDLQEAIAREREMMAVGRKGLGAPEKVSARYSPSAHEDQPVSSAVEAYRRHLTDLQRQKGSERVDASRLDAEIAVRLQLTGYGRPEIVKAIQIVAAADRPQERRDWKRYADRTANFAFGFPGGRLGERLRPEIDRLFWLEGRRRNERELMPPGDPVSRFRF